MHKISYFGGKVRGYGWSCKCGEKSGSGAGDDHPWEYSYERTWDAHMHLIAVGQPPAWYLKDHPVDTIDSPSSFGGDITDRT